MTISVSNNSDGTFTVQCGSDSVVVGTPKATGTGLPPVTPFPPVATPFPPVSSAGGGVTAQIFDSSTPVPGAHPMASFHDLLASLQASLSDPAALGGADHGKPLVLSYAFRGAHAVDISKIHELTRGLAHDRAVQCRLYFDTARD